MPQCKARASSSLEMKHAKLLIEGFYRARAEHLEPNYFITVRWIDTAFADRPFLGVQRLLERLRKLRAAWGPHICFWVREREAAACSVEHVHIATLLSVTRGELISQVSKWVGALNEHAVDVRKCGDRPGWDARSLVTGYFLKGSNPAVRKRYLTAKQRAHWKANQGAIYGKRAGVSHAISRNRLG